MKQWDLINDKNIVIGVYQTWQDALASLVRKGNVKDFRVIENGYKKYEVNTFIRKFTIKFNWERRI